MSFPTSSVPVMPDRSLHRVALLTVALFLSYLCVAMSLPVVSVYVTTRLGFGNALAGLAIGIAFASTILTRGLAGRMADRGGGKRCMIQGLWIYVVAGPMCAAASWPGLPRFMGPLPAGWAEQRQTLGLIEAALDSRAA